MRSAAQATPQVAPARGRPFEKGNRGRRRGSRNRSSLASAVLLEGEKDALLRKAVEIAKGGDVQMLKFLLGHILPRERTIMIDLPAMEFADDAVEALGRITRAVSEGVISPKEGADLAVIINSYTKAIDEADVVKRLDSLEAQISRIRVA